MRLINTDGIAFIRPGSEWFWTAVSGLVLAVTFIAISRQLRIARSIGAREELEGLDRDWDSERVMRYRLELRTAVRDGVDLARLPPGSAAGLSNFWQRMGNLVRSGHFSARTLHGSYSRICQLWWAGLAPGVRLVRAERNQPHLAEDFEWLAGRMAEMDRGAGLPAFDPTRLLELAGSIPMLEGQLRIEGYLALTGSRLGQWRNLRRAMASRGSALTR